VSGVGFVSSFFRGSLILQIGGKVTVFLQAQEQAEGAETVLERVVADATFSLGGLGAGGFLGVCAIGLDAILAGIFGHSVPLI